VNIGYSEMYEGNTHPFIIRIWTEESASESGQAVWRGYITHVPSGKNRYFQTLDAMVEFIIPYLEAMGVEFK
jgi:hypothetical protein